jgi:hypothetical protein
VRAIVAASLLVTTLLSAHTAHARDVGDDPMPVVVDDGQDQGVGAVPSDPPSPDVPVVVVVVPGWPIGGALGQRIYCVEGMESTHGRFMYNRTPVWNGEHAQGYLGFLPSTARAWGVVIGDRASEWNGAARMIRSGAGAQFAGIAWGRC